MSPPGAVLTGQKFGYPYPPLVGMSQRRRRKDALGQHHGLRTTASATCAQSSASATEELSLMSIYNDYGQR